MLEFYKIRAAIPRAFSRSERELGSFRGVNLSEHRIKNSSEGRMSVKLSIFCPLIVYKHLKLCDLGDRIYGRSPVFYRQLKKREPSSSTSSVAACL